MGESKAQAENGVEASQVAALPAVVVGGVSGAGKSALAAAIAEEFGGHVLNADSMQIYRDLPLLTAQPGPELRELAPHRLFGVLPAEEACSVGRWYGLAREALLEARAEAAALAVFVGGTGLYLKAAMEGLAPVPDIPDSVRAKSEQRYDAEGEAGVRAMLARAGDPAAERIKPGDRQRLVRALAVLEATGTPLAAWQAEAARPALVPHAAAVVMLPPRDEAYTACDARFEAILEAGAADEVEALLARDPDPALPLMKAVGVREIAAWLDGSCTREEMIERAQRATRQYVKRQYTWFRNQMPDATRIEEKFSERLPQKIFPKIRDYLLTASR